MKNLAKAMVISPVVRTLAALVLVLAASLYMGTSTVRRGILYYLGVFAPSFVLGIVVGLWTWSWKWFCYALAAGAALTGLALLLAFVVWR